MSPKMSPNMNPDLDAQRARAIAEWAPRWRAMGINPSVYPMLTKTANAELLYQQTLQQGYLDKNGQAKSYVVRFAEKSRSRPSIALHFFAKVLAQRSQPMLCVSFSTLIRSVRELETVGTPTLSNVASLRGKRHIVIHDFMDHPEYFAACDILAALDWLYVHHLEQGALTLGLSGIQREWPLSTPSLLTDYNSFAEALVDPLQFEQVRLT